MREVVPPAEESGVTLLLELLNSRVDHPGYQCDHTNWGARVIEAIQSPNVKLLYDIYHMQIMEGDLVETIRENSSLIGHYHTAGVPGRRDINELQEINYPFVIDTIDKTGYTGFIGHEFIPYGEPIASLQSAFSLTQAALKLTNH